MSQICTHFDAYFERWSAQVGALCTLLIQNRADAQDVAFQTFLRLGGAKDHEIGEEAARMLLFKSAVRLCDDHYLKKMHRRPSRKRLEQMNLPFPVTDALVSLLHLPFRRQAALALLQFGFAQGEIAVLLGVRAQQAAKLCADPGIPGWQDALASMEMTEDEAALLSDRIYERFAVRSVDVENAIHDARNLFDRAAPYLALLVLALFAFSIWYVRR
ncbi:MAG: RNA polymerase sigma factor [Candidatus Ventricola sp.]